MGPLGAAEAWIKSNKVAERPNWLSAEEASTHNKIMSQKGYQGPLNWFVVQRIISSIGSSC